MSGDPHDGLTPPLPLPVRALLRTAVVEHIRSDRRASGHAHIHVGTPGGSTASAAVRDCADDFGTRIEVIHALARSIECDPCRTPDGVPWVWLTRSGPLVVEDLDFGWIGPARHAFAEVGESLTFFVVTHRGWMDPRSGLHRSWSRLRAA